MSNFWIQLLLHTCRLHNISPKDSTPQKPTIQLHLNIVPPFLSFALHCHTIGDSYNLALPDYGQNVASSQQTNTICCTPGKWGYV